ncbi:MAG TPA: hypothetical protein VEI02_12570 [Planctomycetota bacterium]|nr:hypothetical protein [Planctomycetota bacterium]
MNEVQGLRRRVSPSRSHAARRPAALWFLAAVAAAQTPGDAPAEPLPPFPAETAAAMVRLRDGIGSTDDLKAVVEAETAAGRHDVVAWWIETAEPALAGPKAPGPARSAVAGWKRETAKRRAATQDDRVLISKSISRAEGLASRKNYDAARKAVAAAAALLEVVDHPDGMKNLAAVRDRLSKFGGGDADPRDVARDATASSALLESGRARFAGRIEELFTQYETAGCTAGRRVLERAVAAGHAAGWLGDAERGASTTRIRRAARRLEALRRLRLLLRAEGRVAFRLDGAPCIPFAGGEAAGSAESGDAREFRLLPGDRLQMTFDTPISGGDPPMWGVLVSAVLDGKPAPAAVWRQNIAGEPDDPEAKLRPALRGKKTPAKNVLSSVKDEQQKKRIEAAGFVLECPHGDGSQYIAFRPAFFGFEKDLEERGAAAFWLAAVCPKFTLVFATPD